MTRALVQRWRRAGIVKHVVTTDLVAEKFYLLVLVVPDHKPIMKGRKDRDAVDRMYLTEYRCMVEDGWMRDGDPVVRVVGPQPTLEMIGEGWVDDVLVPAMVGSDAD